MYLILINSAVALAAVAGFKFGGVCGWGWAVTWGILIFLAGQAACGFILHKKVKASMGEVQNILAAAQKRLQGKVKQWQEKQQMRPGSVDPKQAQAEMNREMNTAVKDALEASKGMERFINWVPLMKRQIATLRIQLYWMIKDFKRVDELMPQALLVDPMMSAIKLARMHMLERYDGMEKLFRKATLRLRYGQGALLYALYSWILVQRKDYDAAHKILIQANEKMENPIIKANKEALANNKIKSFSNAGFGDQWYALHLEEPKMRVQRPSRFNQRPF